jgi:hypothetical protein
MIEIPLVGRKGAGRVALVDDEDLALVQPYRWGLAERDHTSYAIARFTRDGHRHYLMMHALLAGPRPDHRDGDGLNNQRANLRPATPSQNLANRGPRPGSSSRYKGVSWYPRTGRWAASITVNYRRVHLGYHSAEEDAARAYDAAARQWFGEFARLNLGEGQL